MTDIWEDPSTKAWARHVLDDMVPKMEQSAMVMSVVPDAEHSEGDVKFWVETGAAIMMDKPIIAVVFGDARVPPKLALVADEIVRCPEGVGPEASRELVDAVERILSRLRD